MRAGLRGFTLLEVMVVVVILGILAALVISLLGPFDLGVAILMLVQAATARRVYIFPLARMDFSQVVGGLFAEHTIVKPGISVADDLKKLKQVFPFEEASVLDLGHVAKRYYASGRKLTPAELKTLFGELVGRARELQPQHAADIAASARSADLGSLQRLLAI